MKILSRVLERLFPDRAFDRMYRRMNSPLHVYGHREQRICLDHGAHGMADDEPVTYTEVSAYTTWPERGDTIR